jgi:hypothetical protein
MTLHFTRSDWGESGWKERDDKMVLSIILIRIVDQPVLRGWQGKIERLFTDESQFSFGIHAGKRKKNQKDKQQVDQSTEYLFSHKHLPLSIF